MIYAPLAGSTTAYRERFAFANDDIALATAVMAAACTPDGHISVELHVNPHCMVFVDCDPAAGTFATRCRHDPISSSGRGGKAP